MTEGKSPRWNALRLRGLRQRWIVNTVMPVLVLLILLMTLFSAGVSSYYYRSMQNGLEKQAQALASAFDDYFMDNGFAEYSRKAEQTANSYEDKDRIELQFISSNGRIQVSTSGLTAGTAPGTSDIDQAIAENEMKAFQGKDPETGEKILSVSHPLTFNGRVVGVMRFVTSLRVADRQIMLANLVILAVAILCMALVIISNLLFINNVAEPVAVVTDAAKRISAGSYGIQIENKYTDEMGELVDNINDMSLKIGQNEKMKSEFISSVSHELRTPLTAINGWGETILADPTGDPEQMRRGIRIILNESRRLSTMVEELLEFSKMEDGRFTLRIEEVDLQAEFEDAVFTYRQLFRQEGIDLEYCRPSPETRSGSSRSSATCWTTPPSTAAPASASRPRSARRESTRWSGSGIMAPAFRRRSCPSSSRSSIRARPRPGAAASALRCVMRSSTSTTGPLPSAMPTEAVPSLRSGFR